MMNASQTLIKSSAPSPYLIMSLCWLASFTLSCVLSKNTTAGLASPAGLAATLFTGSRQAFSFRLAEKADMYFHLGSTPKRDLAFSDSFFQRIERQISPDGHVHLKGEVIKETMPWYWLAIKMDPNNIQNYLIAAYWLSGSMNDTAGAHEILMDARRNTSLHHEIELEDAILYFKEKEFKKADRTLLSALNIWPSGGNPTNKDLLIDKIQIHMLKALIGEVTGDLESAVLHFEAVFKITPQDQDLLQRIRTLKKGKEPSLLARTLLNDMLMYRGETQACHRSTPEKSSCSSGCSHEQH